jgi:hypothetical protein
VQILRTEDDGSIRALAIIFTQSTLRQGLRDGADAALSLARSTLVETTRGVFTIDAMLDSLGAADELPHEADRLAADAQGQGLCVVAQGIRLVVRARRHHQGHAPRPEMERPRPGLA